MRFLPTKETQLALVLSTPSVQWNEVYALSATTNPPVNGLEVGPDELDKDTMAHTQMIESGPTMPHIEAAESQLTAPQQYTAELKYRSLVTLKNSVLWANLSLRVIGQWIIGSPSSILSKNLNYS